MAKLFSSTDVFGLMQAELARYGVRVDNLADAYAIYWINAWQATHGVHDDPSKSTVSAVRDQAARSLLQTSEFLRTSDAVKQELAESLWIQAMLINSAAEGSKSDPDMQRAVEDAVAKGARGIGLDLRAMKLTDKGFVLVQ